MTTLEITEDLIETQLQIEEEMTSRGAERYLRGVAKAIEKRTEDATSYGKQIMAARVVILAEAITKWLEETGKGKAATRALAYKKVKDCDPKVLAYLSLKSVLSGISSTRTLQDVA